MNTKYRPDQLEIIGSDLVLKRLRSIPGYHEVFVRCVLDAIQSDYDEITPTFAQNLIAIDSQDGDPHGYFTLGKEVWAAFEAEGDFVGFEVVTRKRGGSIKLGPTFIAVDKRGQGYAYKMIGELVSAYEDVGARKLYVTAPFSNFATAVLDFGHLGLQLEAVLNDHYKRGGAERVCSKFLRAPSVLPMRPHVAFFEHESVALHSGFGTATPADVNEFVVHNMRDDYDDIDDSFIQAMLRGVKKDETVYEHKPKIAVTLFCDDKIVGLAVVAPKRGGTHKVAPFLVDPAFRSEASISLLLGHIISTAISSERTKISLVIPVRDYNIIRVINSNCFYAEGFLRSPYKSGADMVVLSRRLYE